MWTTMLAVILSCPIAKMPRHQKSKLYPIEIVERDEQARRVKVHYTDYGSSDDKWKDEDEIVDKRYG